MKQEEIITMKVALESAIRNALHSGEKKDALNALEIFEQYNPTAQPTQTADDLFDKKYPEDELQSEWVETFDGFRTHMIRFAEAFANQQKEVSDENKIGDYIYEIYDKAQEGDIEDFYEWMRDKLNNK